MLGGGGGVHRMRIVSPIYVRTRAYSAMFIAFFIASDLGCSNNVHVRFHVSRSFPFTSILRSIYNLIASINLRLEL
jgi:hypothetical protein